MEIEVLFRKGYLKEFLVGYYEEQYPIPASKNNELGKWLRVLLSRPPEVPYHIQLSREARELKKKRGRKSPDVERRLQQISKELDFYKNATPVRIKLPEYHGIRMESYNNMTFEAMNTLESFVYDFFNALFNAFVDARMEAGFTKTDSIYQFCYKYNIPMELVNFQSLKKKHDRHVKKKVTLKHNKNVVKMSRQLSRSLTSLKIVL